MRVESRLSSISVSSTGDCVLSGSSSEAWLLDVYSGELIRGSFGGDSIMSFLFLGKYIVVVSQGGIVNI